VTLDSRNLSWLRGRAGATGESVSRLLDGLVTAARQAGNQGPARSVVGTIDVDPSDPDLEGADDAVQTLFERSIQRPLVVRDRRPRVRARSGGKRKRRG